MNTNVNTSGLNGTSTTQTAMDYSVFVGVQSPNLFPAVKIEQNGKSLPASSISKNKGTYTLPSSGYDCGYIDNSWLSHGGICSIAAGNKINLSAGNGGIEFKTKGPNKFMVPYQDFFCENCFNVNTRLFTIAGTERAHLMGGRIDFNFDETYFTGNINFLTNVIVNGGLMVNGGLYCPQITTVKVPNVSMAASDTIRINPNQTFTITIDKSKPLTLKLVGEITEGAKEIQIAEITGGFNLQGDMASNDGETIGHFHEYWGPALRYANSTAEFYEKAQKAFSTDTPITPQPSYPNGCETMEQVKNLFEKEVVKPVKDKIKEFFGFD